MDYNIGKQNEISDRIKMEFDIDKNRSVQVRYGPKQRVAASSLQRYIFGLRPAVAQEDAGPAMLKCLT